VPTFACIYNASTEKASFKIIEEVLTAMNNKELVGGIF
jgi:hypothetical protein